MKRKMLNRFLRSIAVSMVSFSTALSLFGSGRPIIANSSTADVENLILNEENNEQNNTESVPEIVESKEEIKERLVKQINEEGWDPYSEDMSLDEFYALMELFEEGVIRNQADENNAAAPISYSSYFANPIASVPISEPGSEEPAIDEYEANPQSEESEIPFIERDMFLMKGLDPKKFADFDLEPSGSEGLYYPPENWSGVEADSSTQQVLVLGSEDENKIDTRISSRIKQDLFPDYRNEEYYVRRVTANGVNVSVLGFIIAPGGGLVYYYLAEDQEFEHVSTTTVKDGDHFIIEYCPFEHKVEYQIEYEGVVEDEFEVEDIFINSAPDRTTEGAYSFDVLAPYYYEVKLERSGKIEVEDPENPENRIQINPVINLTGKASEYRQALKDAFESYELDNDLVWNESNVDDILDRLEQEFEVYNDGYELGKEPVYTEHRSGSFNLTPNTAETPSKLVVKATFGFENVIDDQKIMASLTYKNIPTFSFIRTIKKVDGFIGRASLAPLGIQVEYGGDFYSYEKDKSGDPAYLYDNGTPKNGLPTTGNIITGDQWKWNTYPYAEEYPLVPDGDAFKYVFTFQTNTGDGELILSNLQINGQSLMLPYFPKYFSDTGKLENSGYQEYQYSTNTSIDHGIEVNITLMAEFNRTDIKQRVYQVTLANVKSNITLSGGNLMMHKRGSPDLAIYWLDGIHADDEAEKGQASAIQEYSDSNEWETFEMSSVSVKSKARDWYYADNGFNIRFKLKDGYSDPWYSIETPEGEFVLNQNREPQTSALLTESGNYSDGTADGEILTPDAPFVDAFGYQTHQRSRVLPGNESIVPLSSLEEGQTPSSRKIYFDEDTGWYYVRVDKLLNDTQSTRFSRLIVVAKPSKYVIRYTEEPFIENQGEDGNFKINIDPETLPCYTNNLFPDLEGSEYETIARFYDDNFGYYYDLFENFKISVASKELKDLNGHYIFTGWLLADSDNQPLLRKTSQGQEEQAENPDKYYRFYGSLLDLKSVEEKLAHIARLNRDLGSIAVNVREIHLIPAFEYIENPFEYSVFVKYLTKEGKIETDRVDLQNTTTRESADSGNKIYVKVHKDAPAFEDWLMNHPGYSFWDDINNLSDAGSSDSYEKQVKEALDQFLEEANITLQEETARFAAINSVGNSQGLVDQIVNRDSAENGNDFNPLGNYSYEVNESKGKIIVWMYENLESLEISKSVINEAFEEDDDFYFEVSESTKDLNGVFYAYLNVTGEEDSNWDEVYPVVFNNGSSSDHLSLKDNDSLKIYLPAGDYFVEETGSRSEGLYIPASQINDSGTFKEGPDSGKIHLEINDPQSVSYSNATGVVDLTKIVEDRKGNEYKNEQFEFTVTLELTDTTNTVGDKDNAFKYIEKSLTGDFISYSKDKNVWTGVFALRDKGSIKLSKLPGNLKVTIKENVAENAVFKPKGSAIVTGTLSTENEYSFICNFVNTNEPDGLPSTGGSEQLFIWISGMSFLALAGIIAALTQLKNKRSI